MDLRDLREKRPKAVGSSGRGHPENVALGLEKVSRQDMYHFETGCIRGCGGNEVIQQFTPQDGKPCLEHAETVDEP